MTAVGMVGESIPTTVVELIYQPKRDCAYEFENQCWYEKTTSVFITHDGSNQKSGYQKKKDEYGRYDQVLLCHSNRILRNRY